VATDRWTKGGIIATAAVAVIAGGGLFVTWYQLGLQQTQLDLQRKQAWYATSFDAL
jgi:hypothetical protein